MSKVINGKRMPETDDEIIYTESLLNLIACAPKELSKEEVVSSTRAHNPCGTLAGWVLSEDGFEDEGGKNPCKCLEMPDERLHYLFAC